MNWQPIETAPHDGTWCVFTSTWNRYARWCANWDGSAWIDQWDREDDLSSFTHWQPLPEPPTEDTHA